MPAIPITAIPQKISGTASKPYLITNDPDSVATIYLGQSSNVSQYNYGVKVTPGSSLTWNKLDTEVWAVTAGSGGATVTVLYEADAVASNSVSAVSANLPVLLQTITRNFTAGIPTLTTDVIPDTVIQNYASIKVMVSVNLTALGSTDLGSGAYIRVAGIQTDTALGNVLSNYSITNQAVFSFGDGVGIINTGLQPGIATYQFPVTNTYLSSSFIQYTTGSGTPSGTVTVRIFGLGETIQQEKYINYPGNIPVLVSSNKTPTAGVMLAYTAAAPISTQYDLPSKNGLANFLLSSSSAGLTRIGYSLWAYFPIGNQLIHKRITAAPGTIGDGTNDTIYLPNLPIQYRIEASGAGNANYTVLQVN